MPGTYLNSFYEKRPLPYAEGGYGYPESGQTIINVTNGKLIRLLVEDEPFDVRYGELRHHERMLDLRAGTLHPRASSGRRRRAGRSGRARTRLVSLTQRADRGDPLRGRGPRRARRCSSSSPSSWPTSSCPRPTTPTRGSRRR